MLRVFTYGSLMFDRVWSQVVVGDYRSESGVLHGHCRLALRGEDYPGVIPAGGEDQVEGRLYHEVSLADIERLDVFEGIYYERRNVMIETQVGQVEAETYIFRENYRHLLADWPWSVEHFERKGIERFTRLYSGYDA